MEMKSAETDKRSIKKGFKWGQGWGQGLVVLWLTVLVSWSQQMIFISDHNFGGYKAVFHSLIPMLNVLYKLSFTYFKNVGSLIR